MKPFILGKKIGMTRVFDETGQVVPVTVIEAGPCTITQIKTVEQEGYAALQLGFVDKKSQSATKPEVGHFKKADTEPKRFVRESRLDEDPSGYEVGQEITLEQFKDVKIVDVVGTTKGKGFAGVVKRYNMGGGPKTHGSTRHRRVGSIGQSAYPSRVFPGKRMPGHMGNEQKTVKGLKVVRVDEEANLLLLKGAVPGSGNGFVIVKRSNRDK